MANTEVTKSEDSSAGPQAVDVKLRKILVSVNLETFAAIDGLPRAQMKSLIFLKMICMTNKTKHYARFG